MEKYTRDSYIDFVRGLTSISIIFIHTVWWSGEAYVPFWLRQASLLIDVPIFFFLAGLTLREKDYLSTLKGLLNNQLKWLFFLVLYSIFFICVTDSNIQWITFLKSNFYSFDSNIIWSYPVLFGSMWFMPVFITVSILFIFVRLIFDYSMRKKLIDKLYLFVTLILIFFYISLGFNFFYLPILASFYLIFYSFGFLAIDIQKISLKYFVISLLTLLFLQILIIKSNTEWLNLQVWKFGPSVEYLVPSFFSISIILFFRHRLMFKDNIMMWIGKNAMFIYFAQGISSSLLFKIGNYISVENWLIRLSILFFINVAIALIITFLLNQIYLLVNLLFKKILTILHQINL